MPLFRNVRVVRTSRHCRTIKNGKTFDFVQIVVAKQPLLRRSGPGGKYWSTESVVLQYLYGTTIDFFRLMKLARKRRGIS
jgi:hypothetical protein